MTKSKLYGLIGAFIAVIIWGSMFRVKSHLLTVLTPIQINFYTAILTATLYLLLHFFTKTSLRLEKKTIGKIMIAGGIGIALTRVSCDIGIKYVGEITASVFSSLIPIMCIIFDSFFRKKRPRLISILSVGLSILGVYLLISTNGQQEFHIAGYLWLFISNCSWIFYCYFCSKWDSSEINDNTFMLYLFFGGGIVLLPSMFAASPSVTFLLRWDIILCFLFLGIVNGIFAYRLFAFAVREVGILTANVINNFMPVITLVIGISSFGAHLSFLQGVGIVVVLLSVIAISWDQKN